MSSHLQSVGAVTGPSLPITAGLAGGISAVANALLFGVAVLVGVFPAFTLDPAAGTQMAVELILMVSVFASAAAISVFGLMRRRVDRPIPAFVKLAAVVLVLSFAAPFVIPGTGGLQAVVLNVMHVIVAATVLGLLYRRHGT